MGGRGGWGRAGFVFAVLLFGVVLPARSESMTAGLRAAVDSVRASGPDAGTTLEDRIEVFWSTAADVTSTTTFEIERDGTLIHAAASTASLYYDLTAVPDVDYEYRVFMLPNDGTNTRTELGVDTGRRVIAPPTGFEAGDGADETHVHLSWSDRSEIEAGYLLYRDAGRALVLDGSDDFVRIANPITVSESFTFEFWAQRSSTGTDDYVVNIEANPNGDPTTIDVEIGFEGNQLIVRSGTEVIAEGLDDSGAGLHHYAIVYDGPNRRWILYRDGALLGAHVFMLATSTTGLLEFGRREDTGSPGVRGHYHGTLDEIRYWTKALTGGEVAAAMGSLLQGSATTGLSAYWPMDAPGGTLVPDVAGVFSGVLVNTDGSTNRVASPLPERFVQLAVDQTAYMDDAAIPGYDFYTYRLAAFQDMNENGVYDAGVDYTSAEKVDTGWRALLTPPGDVMATDGQFQDRVRLTWIDLSSAEASYTIERDGVFLASVAANATTYDDLTATGTHTYCVMAADGGVASEPTCDEGRVGGLAPPEDVAATDRTLDDRITIDWIDPTDTESGFEIYRGAPGDDFVVTPGAFTLLFTADAGTETYDDVTAVQDVAYQYCVRAYSDADPLLPTYSDAVCAVGTRAIILDPTDLAVSQGDFEERVDLSWTNVGTTTMLYEVYRDCVPNADTTAVSAGTLFEVLDFSRTSTSDRALPSDAETAYCVVGVTVLAPQSVQLQSDVAQVLATIRHADAVAAVADGSPGTPPEAKLAAALATLDTGLGTEGAAASNLVESAPIIATGYRSLNPPTGVDATDNDFEGRVEVEWSDESAFETGYSVFRTPLAADDTPSGPVELAASLSANRTTYSDFGGTPGQRYRYAVQAFDDYGVSALAADDGEVQNAGIRTLNPPTRFEASDGTDEMEILLSWQDNSAAETAYRIERRLASGTDADYAMIAETNPNEVVYLDMVPAGLRNVALRYRLTAIDDFGSSVAITDEGSTRIERPLSVNASDSYGNTVIVVWVDRSAVETNYHVTRRELGTSTFITLDDTLPANTAQYVDATAVTDIAYEYCVAAFAGTTTLSSEASCDEGGAFTGSTAGPTNPDAQPWLLYTPPTSFTADIKGQRQGFSVAIDGGQALVGAPGQYPGTFIATTPGLGQANFYDVSGANQWAGAQSLFSVPRAPEHEFGYAVAFDAGSSWAVVGDPDGGVGQKGSVEFWKKSGNSWSKDTTLLPTAMVDFGHAVDVDGSYAVVSDPQSDGTNLGGKATICPLEPGPAARDCRPGDTNAIRLNLQLPANTLQDGHEFGYDVAINVTASEILALVGAPGNDAAYLFGCDLADPCTTPGAHWKLLDTFVTPFGQNDRFGAALDMADDLIVIGASGAEAVQIYQRKPDDTDTSLEGRNIFQEMLPYSPPGDAEEFGFAVAVDGTNILVGAPGEDLEDYEDAGAAYAFAWNLDAEVIAGEVTRYDGRVLGDALPGFQQSYFNFFNLLTAFRVRQALRVRADGRFGASVAISNDTQDGVYVIGSPGPSALDGFALPGWAYAVPFGTEASAGLLVPGDVDLVDADRVEASDGTSKDRIVVKWRDESDDEEGYLVYRSNDAGEMELLAEVGANIEFYNDTEAAPGEAYEYCVTAFYGEAETEMRCDIGWRPPNGTIAGQLAVGNDDGDAAAGTADALVCLDPSPNRAFIFDGTGGYVTTPAGDETELFQDFTIEAWVRPHVAGAQTIVARDSSYIFGLDASGHLQLRIYASASGTVNVTDVVATGLGALQTGTWQHVAVVMERGRGSNGRALTFYLDDAAQDFPDNANAPQAYGDSLYIGSDGEASGDLFEGEIDEVRLWKTSRLPEEIAATRDAPLEGDEENLVGYWALDQGNRFIVPDLSESANHGRIIDGAYVTVNGAPLNICAVSNLEGNFSIPGIRYGESTEFRVIPTREDRVFSPTFRQITLTTESPVDNQVIFNDVTAYPVQGQVNYVVDLDDLGGTPQTFTCPVPNVRVHYAKKPIPNGDNLGATTGDDGSYVIAVTPSLDANDPWIFIPQFTNEENDEVVHTFTPAFREEVVNAPLVDISFADDQRHTLSGYFSGGDPQSCGKFIGTAQIRVYTQDGCLDHTFEVDSGDQNGYFEIDLPPLEYLVEIDVVDVTGLEADFAAEVQAFFSDLGAIEVDLTEGDVERNLSYRAPIELLVAGFEDKVPQSCPVLTQFDEDGAKLRELPQVPIIGEYEGVLLEISVAERYGPGVDEVCTVESGDVIIFDGISDRADADSTMQIEDGKVEYTTYGLSPNIFSGARVGGVDRSFQKPFTVAATVDGRPTIVDTRWVMVEGYRERASTFVSATTEQFPLMLIPDPPGSNSNAFLSKGTTVCNTMSSTFKVSADAGVAFNTVFGFKETFVVAPFGVGKIIEVADTEVRVGINLGVGGSVTSLLGGAPNRTICMTTDENFSTSNDAGFVGEDIHMGVALNLIFAIADVLEIDGGACAVNLSETLAADLDQNEPFASAYAYGKSHIGLTLIPELDNLIRLAGKDASVTGTLPDEEDETTIRLKTARQNWARQLENAEELKAEAVAASSTNRSFSGGADLSYSETFDTTKVTNLIDTNVYLKAGGTVGSEFKIFGQGIKFDVTFGVQTDFDYKTEDTQGSSQTVGYLFSDGDTGDFFSVDVGKIERYGTFAFETVSGRSSNPWEANTQKRDNPILMIDPPVQFNVDPNGAARFDVTLINGSESDERRRYKLEVVPETNTGNLGFKFGSTAGAKIYNIDPGTALSISMDVTQGAGFSFKDVAMILYPPDEYPIWAGDTRLPFALSDTARFDVYFDSTGGGQLAAQLSEGWNWMSINREAGSVDAIFADVPIRHGDLLRAQNAESRYDSTTGWTGKLKTLEPGRGYRLRLQESAFFRLGGDPVTAEAATPLSPGWNWIGYLPARRMPVAEALASLDDRVIEGDAVVGQHGFAQYVRNVGWIGTLHDLEPGQSYELYLDGGGELLYPEAPEEVAPRAPVVRETTVRGPEWTVEAGAYDASMTVVADIQLGGGSLRQTTTKLAVFDGDEIRGMGEVYYVEALDQYLTFILIYGGADEERDLVVHVYDGEKDLVYERVATIGYEAQKRLGQPASPVVIELTAAGQAPELLDLPETFALHPNFPNPFNTHTTIGYDLPEASDVELVVYDLLGRRVATLVDGEQGPGRHKVVFNGRVVASGFYFYRMTIGETRYLGKMILVK